MYLEWSIKGKYCTTILSKQVEIYSTERFPTTGTSPVSPELNVFDFVKKEAAFLEDGDGLLPLVWSPVLYQPPRLEVI